MSVAFLKILSLCALLVALCIGLYLILDLQKLQKRLLVRRPSRNSKASAGFRAGWYELFESKYIEQSGIATWLNWVQGWHLIVLAVLATMTGAFSACKMTQVMGMILPGALIGGALPFKAIHFYRAYEDQTLRREMPLFFGLMGKWAAIQPELYFCLNKVLKADIHPKIKGYIRQLLIEIGAGEPAQSVFERVERKIGAGLLRDYFICLRQLELHSGDLAQLTGGFETESLHVEIEVSKRKASMLKQNVMLQVLNGFGFLFLFNMMSTNKVLAGFYIGSAMGNWILVAVGTLFGIFFILSTSYLNDSL